jgi:RNA polymerase sigma factor (sigma-70 family)
MNTLPLRSQDQELVRRCLAEDDRAWADLFHTHHRQMVGLLTRSLHGHGVPAGAADELAQEVASEVWLKLMANGRRRLRSFDPRRGRFGTYLAAVARNQLTRTGTRRKRQSVREEPLPEHAAPGAPEEEMSFDAWIEDLEPRLSRRERAYFRQELLGRFDPDQPASFTPGGAWKLKGRVLRKLTALLEGC